jgi:polyhydroxyalkanoate synthesis regulator phasin
MDGLMSEEEPNLRQLLSNLIEELQGFRYSLYTWREELSKYKEQTIEHNKIYAKLSEITDKELVHQSKIFEDNWLRLIVAVGYMDSKVEKIYTFMENRLVNLITELSTTLNKTNDGLVKIGEISEKFVEGQVKTNDLLEDIKKLLQQQLEIKKQTALESAKLKKKIEKEIGE